MQKQGKKLLQTVAFAATMGIATSVMAATEIQWWHAMGGVNGERVNKIASDFNATQADFKVVPVYKGNYEETLTAGIAAFRAGEQPDIIQVFDAGAATIISAKGAVIHLKIGKIVFGANGLFHIVEERVF